MQLGNVWTGDRVGSAANAEEIAKASSLESEVLSYLSVVADAAVADVADVLSFASATVVVAIVVAALVAAIMVVVLLAVWAALIISLPTLRLPHLSNLIGRRPSKSPRG